MSSAEDPKVRSLNEVLVEEARVLERDLQVTARGYAHPENPKHDEGERANNLRQIYSHIGRLRSDERFAALCLSGGGIRSATFNLGVIQGLARLGILERLDYLSTVSGGGYIGGWLKAWMSRDGARAVLDELRREGPEQPLKPEPRQVDRLREFSNYLTPRRGLVSGDTWAAVAIVVRNLLLNWLVVVPGFLATVALPLGFEMALRLPDDRARATWGIVVASLLATVASMLVHSTRGKEDRERAKDVRAEGDPHRRLVRGGVLLLVVAAATLALSAAWLPKMEMPLGKLIVFSGIWFVLIPIIGWLGGEPSLIESRDPNGAVNRRREWQWHELPALIASGVLAALPFIGLTTGAFPRLVERPVLYATFAVPLLLALYLISRTLFVGFTDFATRNSSKRGIVGRDDADREWWARFSGFVLLASLVWMAIFAISLVGWVVAKRLFDEYAARAVAGLGGIAGLLAVVIGKSGKTGSGREGGQGPTPPAATKEKTSSRRAELTLAIAAPAFCVAIFVLLSHSYFLMARQVAAGVEVLFGISAAVPRAPLPAKVVDLLVLVAPILLLGLLAWVAGAFVNVNRFSLHGLYRNRLVRAYLGASNRDRDREVDRFTGFAKGDNIAMHELWHPPGGPANTISHRPLLIVNATLNLVRGERLGWQERKAESFSISPLFCGNFYEGYRRSKLYGGRNGITLGTALTISGAAANPNMGYHSSPAVTFLLGLFNARLGAWLGNTNAKGNETFRHQGPRNALRPLFAELFGMTDAKGKYIQLSDGGHFDNLGLYEMVLRRCRFIIVSDAGMDRSASFADLGNAIRKIRIDFGVPIEFTERIGIVSRDDTSAGMLCARGVIRYSRVDQDVPDGELIYLKPTLDLRGKGRPIPYDVFSYHKASEEFPHESTMDQWFDESQFESYRALGEYLMERITESLKTEHGTPRTVSLDQFLEAVDHSLGRLPKLASERPADIGDRLLDWFLEATSPRPKPV